MLTETKSENKPEQGKNDMHINAGIIEEDTVTHDAVFGDITEEGPNYRNVGWIGTTALLVKTQIGLGVLSMPAIFHVVGLIPGLILLILIAAVTTWSDYEVGVFKMNHRHVYGIDDVGRMLFGRIGYEVFGFFYCINFTFVTGSAMLGISIALNAVSTHAVCTAVFVAIAAIMSFSFSSIQTLGRISWLAWFGAFSIITAVFVVTVAVGLQDRPSEAPVTTGEWKSDYVLFASPTFTSAMSVISTLVFTYSGTPAFFNIVAEMRDPRQYTKSLIVCQVLVTSVYIIVATVIYFYCGSYVASPALGSAGPLIKKVGYGIALPGLMASAMLLSHLPAKHIFIRILRGSPHLTANTPIHWITWLGSTGSVNIVAYIIASSIPIFGTLVSLIGALSATLLTFQPYGCMWLYDNWTKDRTPRWYMMVTWSVLMIVGGTFIMVAGTYSAIIEIINTKARTGPWSCADNSNST